MKTVELVRLFLHLQIDDTADISAGVSFSLSGTDADKFNIDTSSGAVTLLANPDAETQSEYSFEITATDAAGNASETKSITLNVNNLDEVPPRIISSDTANEADVIENIDNEVQVYTATSNESGSTFYLTDESDPEFSIDAVSGAVTFTGNPDFETKAEYSFGVFAIDIADNEGEPQQVTLTVNNTDDTGPIVTSSAVATSIDENTAAGQVIYTATAEDDSSDVEAVGSISFSLADGSDVGLSIDSETGEVTLNESPDADTKSQYNFAVIATDAAGNDSSAQSVTLDINDLDDTAPQITSAEEAVTNQNIGPNQIVYVAQSDDSADVSSGGITFSLEQGSDSALSIDVTTGEVTLSDDPDFEDKPEYSFEVVATDAAGNISESKPVVLRVLPDVVELEILEEALNVDVYTAEANDSADITYSLNSAIAAKYEKIGAIKQTFINDPDNDNSIIMQLSLTETAIELLPSTGENDEKLLENFDLVIGYEQTKIKSLTYIDSDDALSQLDSVVR